MLALGGLGEDVEELQRPVVGVGFVGDVLPEGGGGRGGEFEVLLRLLDELGVGLGHTRQCFINKFQSILKTIFSEISFKLSLLLCF